MARNTGAVLAGLAALGIGAYLVLKPRTASAAAPPVTPPPPPTPPRRSATGGMTPPPPSGYTPPSRASAGVAANRFKSMTRSQQLLLLAHIAWPQGTTDSEKIALALTALDLARAGSTVPVGLIPLLATLLV